MIPARRIMLVLFGLSLASLAAFCAGPRAAARLEPQEKKVERRHPPELLVGGEIVTRQAVCRWAAQPPLLDGKLDDRCWQKAVVIDRFATFWTDTQTPQHRDVRLPGLGRRRPSITPAR